MIFKKSFFSYAVFVCVLGVNMSCRTQHASETSFPHKSHSLANQTSAYVQNQILVRLKEDSKLAPVFVEVFEKKEAFASVTGDSYLDQLHQKYPIQSIEPLFEQKQSFEDIMRKFPERAKRMPKSVKIPNVALIYKITFKGAHHMPTVVRDFEKDVNFEYVQLDHMATINQEDQ